MFLFFKITKYCYNSSFVKNTNTKTSLHYKNLYIYIFNTKNQ
ncbi:MAG: hypothetical protein H6Q20_1098 [Bacteroidetes bacterium]|nr:hypothetical protein [Bacteroidota bacterium]